MNAISQNRFKKRRGPITTPETLQGQQRQEISNWIRKQNYSAAFTALDEWAGKNEAPEEQSRILCFVADVDFQQGKWEEAVQKYRLAFEKAAFDPILWLRPVIGQIRALLKGFRLDEAIVVARKSIELAQQKETAFQTQLQQISQQLLLTGSSQVEPRPFRVSVVATRLGYLFLEEGETTLAKELFSTAMTQDPDGTCKARTGLAQIALRESDPQTALTRAQEAIQCGLYRARTLSAWPILIEACHQLQQELPSSLLSRLAQAPVSVRGRAFLQIIRALRQRQNPQWPILAKQWLNSEPKPDSIVEATIRGILLSSERLQPQPTVQTIQAAQQLLKVEGLAFSEWRAAIKAWIKTACRLNQFIDFDFFLSETGNRFGKTYTLPLRHSLALACVEGQNPALARSLFEQNIASARPESSIWGKSIWSLARLELQEGNLGVAANHFLRLSQQPAQPSRFRLWAQLKGCQCLIEQGDTESIVSAKPQIQALIGQVTDYELLLDFARKLHMGSDSLQELSAEIFVKGRSLAIETFHKTSNPIEAGVVLFKLARRQIDFGKVADILDFWNSLSSDKQTALWSSKSEFWEYQSLIFNAYVITNQLTQAEQFARTILNDPATPLDGIGFVGVYYATLQIDQNKTQEAFVWFEKIAASEFRKPVAAVAFYWLAIRALKTGNSNEVKKYGQQMIQILGRRPNLLWQRRLAASALLFEMDLNVPAALQTGLDGINENNANTEKDSRRIRSEATVIQKDMTRLKL